MKNRMKELRARHNYTQKDLAKLVNVSRQTIYAVEKNKYGLSLKLAFNIAEALESRIEEVFEYEKNIDGPLHRK